MDAPASTKNKWWHNFWTDKVVKFKVNLGISCYDPLPYAYISNDMLKKNLIYWVETKFGTHGWTSGIKIPTGSGWAKNASFDRLMTHCYSPSVYMSARNISLIVYGVRLRQNENKQIKYSN